MSNIRHFPDRRTIDLEASQWLGRLDADEPLQKEELESLREWLARSPAHRQALTSLNAFWANNVLTELIVPPGRNEGLIRFLSFRVFNIKGWNGALVTLSLIAFLSLTLFITSAPEFETNGLYVTAVGQQKNLILDDGSTVLLNTNSQIRVEYNDKFRNIHLLQGEAHFDVSKNPERPFRVYAGAGRVQALGTAFTIHIQQNDVKVLVTEGRIALASLGGSVLETGEQDTDHDQDPFVHTISRDLGVLDAGQAVSLEVLEGLYVDQLELRAGIEFIEEDEIDRLESWREGFLVFSGESLEQVVSEICRYTTLSIEIADPDLKQLQIGGRFKVGDVENMFAALEANFGIQAERVNYNQVKLKTAK